MASVNSAACLHLWHIYCKAIKITSVSHCFKWISSDSGWFLYDFTAQVSGFIYCIFRFEFLIVAQKSGNISATSWGSLKEFLHFHKTISSLIRPFKVAICQKKRNLHALFMLILIISSAAWKTLKNSQGPRSIGKQPDIDVQKWWYNPLNLHFKPHVIYDCVQACFCVFSLADGQLSHTGTH